MKKQIYDFLKDILEQAGIGSFIVTLIFGVTLFWEKALDFLLEMDWYEGYDWVGIVLFIVYIISFLVTLTRFFINKRT